jgi:hypothetical protein
LESIKIFPLFFFASFVYPACPVAPADGTGVAPEDGTGAPLRETFLFQLNNLRKSAESADVNEHLTNMVAFHSQQAIEKSIKAVLEEKENHVPRMHVDNDC